jgi:hypothetical protein
MHKGTRVLLLIAIVASVTLRILAQDIIREYDSTLAPALPSEDDRKYTLFKRFLDVYHTDETTAYEVAKECLDKYSDSSEQTKYLRKWVGNFLTRGRLAHEQHIRQLIDSDRFYEAFKEGSDLLKSEPEDIAMLCSLADVALRASGKGDLNYNEDGVAYAKQALKLAQAGRAIENKNKVIAWLNEAIGILSMVRHPDDAVSYFYNAVQSEEYRSDALTYAFLADSLLAAEYAPLQNKYSVEFRTVQQKLSIAGQLLRQRLYIVTDAIIDALARAVALAHWDSQLQDEKARWLDVLTALYKFRNSGYETGLKEFIANVLKTPIAVRIAQK